MSVKPFKIEVRQTVLDDLKQRLANTRWPDEIEAAGWNYGTNEAYLKELVTYWQHDFDWRQQETALNQFEHFKTELDGLNIHFIHARGKGPNPVPLILTHGWPDSFYRFAKIIPMLTDPAAYGGDPADSFDVVVPSMPGYGFSDASLKPGMDSARMANLWVKLMTEELGYERFAAHGGDVGSSVTLQLALLHPEKLIGIHFNGVPFEFRFQPPTDLAPEEQQFLTNAFAWQQREGAYNALQSTKPQTLSYGLNDSPTGLAAWIIEKFRAWSDCNGDIEQRFSKDELLTNLMIYWVTNTIGSANRYYYEATQARLAAKPIGKIALPTGVGIFPKDIVPAPRVWAERWLKNIQQWTEMPRGGHFAAMEEPQLAVEDLQTFFRTLR